MDKLVFALEEWDSLLNYYRPNGSSKTWYLKEEGKIQHPKMWGEWNLDFSKIYESDNVNDMVTPYFDSNTVQFKSYDDIGDENYYYLINVFNPSFFEDNINIGFSCISEHYQKDIISGKCTLLILFGIEGYFGMEGNRDPEILNKWISDSGFPKESVLMFGGNLMFDRNNVLFNYIPIQIFDIWIPFYRLGLIRNVKKSYKKLFLSYNRNVRYHKFEFILRCKREGIIDNLLFSLGDITEYNHADELIEFNNKFTDNPSIGTDISNDINILDFDSTFMSIVTETLTDKGTLFVTEKTWKAIIAKHPFMIIGSRGTLKYLKSLGFKTFDKWWDESYDNYDGFYEKIDIIISNMKMVINLSDIERYELNKKLHEICDYNSKVFNKIYDKKYLMEGGDNPYYNQHKNMIDLLLEWK